MPTIKTGFTITKDGSTVGTRPTITTTTDGDGPSWAAQIAAATANHHITPFTVTVALLKFVYIESDASCDLYTNDLSSGSPTQHIVLTAGHPIIWNVGDAAACPLTGNITAGIYATTTTDAANLVIVTASHIG